ncbi:MAG: SDR family oxidoreductase [Beijerinckiaceae bacterium]
MNIVVFGMGYSASRWARSSRQDAICGTYRSVGKLDSLRRMLPNVTHALFGSIEVATRIDTANALLVSTPPVDGHDPALAQYRQAIASSRVSRIVYLSTIGVYGGQDGAWVDEDTPPVATSRRGADRVSAEREWLDFAAGCGKRAYVLRLAGIYGPGRNALLNLRQGTAKRIVRDGQVFNRIHVDDIAQAIDACLTTDTEGGVFNVSDDEPSPPQDVISYGARLLGMPPPPEIAFDKADLSPMARSFWANNQRVSNRLLKETLGVSLRYPTYREGLTALLNDV